MTEPVEVLIQLALLNHLKTPELTSPATPRASPLASYTPTKGVAYLDARPILRAAPEHPSLAFTGSIIRRGIFQVDVVVPDNAGEAPGLRLAALICARFAIGTKLTAGTYKLQISSPPVIAAAVKDAPWVRFPVSIPYLVIT